MKTWGVSWYVEVRAESEEQAVHLARAFLDRKYRLLWEPMTVEEMEDEL